MAPRSMPFFFDRHVFDVANGQFQFVYTPDGLFRAIIECDRVSVAAALDSDPALANAAGQGFSALHLAVVSGDVPVVNTLLAREVHVNGLDGHTLSPLYHAASRGDVAMVQALLGHQHIDLNVGRVTPLIGASIHGHVAVVNLLLGHGAPLNAVCRLDGEGVAFTALAGACAFGHMEVARALILHGVDLFWASTEVGTALEYARRRGYDQVADELTLLVNQLTLAKAAVLCGLSADKSGVLAEREREGGAAPAVELDEWGQLVLKGLAPDLQKEMADYLP